MGVGGGSARPRPLEQGACARAESSKTHEERTRKTKQDPRPRRSPFPRVHSPLRKDAFCLLAAPVAGGRSREGTIFPLSPRRRLSCWQHMPLVGCLLELQAGLARSAVTQERSPGALARRNPEEASFYKLPVRRLHRGIGETRAWR